MGKLFQVCLSVFGAVVGKKAVFPSASRHLAEKSFGKGKEMFAQIDGPIHIQDKHFDVGKPFCQLFHFCPLLNLKSFYSNME